MPRTKKTTGSPARGVNWETRRFSLYQRIVVAHPEIGVQKAYEGARAMVDYYRIQEEKQNEQQAAQDNAEASLDEPSV